MRTNKQHYIYTLNLEGEKKYVGITSNPEKRLNDHINGNGAKMDTETCTD